MSEEGETLQKHCNPENMSEEDEMLQKQCNSNKAVEGYDFSFLPELIWIQIMQFLNLKSRYYLSLTCHTIYGHFHYHSLWHQLTIRLEDDNTHLLIPMATLNIIEKFGRFAKKLTLVMGTGNHIKSDEMWNRVMFDDGSREMVMKLNEVCQLDSLTVEARKIRIYHISGILMTTEPDMKMLVSLITNASSLKTLNIRSWPSEQFAEDYDICSVITENPNLGNLESLSLFWMGDRHWQGREPLLPSPVRLLTLLTNMKKLSKLALKSPMLSSEILMLLASPERNKLKLLKIDIAYSSSNNNLKIPDISSEAWSELTRCSPELKVECSVMVRLPDTEISAFLKPEMPLSSMTFLKHSRCTGEMMSFIADKFQGTLRTFNCYAAISDVDHELLSLVNTCSKLDSLLFHGTISCSSVIAIATKNRKWENLEFLEKEIETLEDDRDDEDENEVIRINQEGELFLVNLNRFHRTDENRGEKINQMIDVVSEAIGYKWHPV